MLSVFSMFNNTYPQYTAAFIIELWSSDRYTVSLFYHPVTMFPHSGYFVKFHYRNQTSSDVIEEIFHPDCKIPCSLEKLSKLAFQIVKPT